MSLMSFANKTVILLIQINVCVLFGKRPSVLRKNTKQPYFITRILIVFFLVKYFHVINFDTIDHLILHVLQMEKLRFKYLE